MVVGLKQANGVRKSRQIIIRFHYYNMATLIFNVAINYTLGCFVVWLLFMHIQLKNAILNLREILKLLPGFHDKTGTGWVRFVGVEPVQNIAYRKRGYVVKR